MFFRYLPFALLSISVLYNAVIHAEQQHIVNHVDTIEYDAGLTLSTLLQATVKKYPDFQQIKRLQQESAALQQRGNYWIAGAVNIGMTYRDDFAGSNQGAYEFEGAVGVPLWNWGQREAGQNLAKQAEQMADFEAQVINLKVAGLMRLSLWHMALQDLNYVIAKKSYQLTEKLVKTVQRRVELGDLARADLLLVQSELFQKRSVLLQAEAELMHARKAFYFLTQDNKAPKNIEESMTTVQALSMSHPDLVRLDAVISKKQAAVTWIKAQGSGQTNVSIGGTTERGARGDATSDSINFGISIPFGGSAFLAPKIAVAETALMQAKIEKSHLYRQLQSELHEAKHELDIAREQWVINQQMANNAQEYLKMSGLSFESGEINLMDFLKIQERAYHALQQRQISALKIKRNIALYNQAVGVAP